MKSKKFEWKIPRKLEGPDMWLIWKPNERLVFN